MIGSQGFYVDLSDFDDDGAVDATVADFLANRALIERAFDILVWRSQETNTRLRKLVVHVIDDFTTQLQVPPEVRAHAHHLLLTAHNRINPASEKRVMPRSDAS